MVVPKDYERYVDIDYRKRSYGTGLDYRSAGYVGTRGDSAFAEAQDLWHASGGRGRQDGRYAVGTGLSENDCECSVL